MDFTRVERATDTDMPQRRQGNALPALPALLATLSALLILAAKGGDGSGKGSEIGTNPSFSPLQMSLFIRRVHPRKKLAIPASRGCRFGAASGVSNSKAFAAVMVIRGGGDENIVDNTSPYGKEWDSENADDALYQSIEQWHVPLSLPKPPWAMLWGHHHNATTGKPKLGIGEFIGWAIGNITITFLRTGDIFTPGTTFVTSDRIVWVPRNLSQPSWALNHKQLGTHSITKSGLPSASLSNFPSVTRKLLSQCGFIIRCFRNTSNEARQAAFHHLKETPDAAAKEDSPYFPRVRKPRDKLWRPKDLVQDAALMPLLRNDIMGFDVHFSSTKRSLDDVYILYRAVSAFGYANINPHGDRGIPHRKLQPEKFEEWINMSEKDQKRLQQVNNKLCGIHKDVDTTKVPAVPITERPGYAWDKFQIPNICPHTAD